MKDCTSALTHALCTNVTCQAIQAAREILKSDEAAVIFHEDIAREASRRAHLLAQPSLRRVVNATGVVIHTNLGRRVATPSAVKAVAEVARGYSTLEYNTDTQARGSRHDHCEKLICQLTGAEAAIAVNNNADAAMMVFLSLLMAIALLFLAVSWLRLAVLSAFLISWRFLAHI